jgi:hypothetical protein
MIGRSNNMKDDDTNDSLSEEIRNSISELVEEWTNEMLTSPIYTAPLSNAAEVILKEKGWKLALTPSYIQDNVRCDPVSPLKRMLAEMPAKD